jgi:hypothetical protein
VILKSEWAIAICIRPLSDITAITYRAKWQAYQMIAFCDRKNAKNNHVTFERPMNESTQKGFQQFSKVSIEIRAKKI